MIPFPSTKTVIERVTATAIRNISYWALGIALVLLVAMGAYQAWRLQRDLESREVQRAEQDLRRQAQVWDEAVSQRAGAWLQDLGEQPDIASRQLYYRGTVPWFDSYYLWELAPGQLGPDLVFPTRVPVEDLPTLNSSPCIRQAHLRADALPRSEAPRLFRACSRDPDPRVALFASTEAATRLLALGRADEAVAALSESGVPLDLAPRAAAAEGLAPRRIVLRRLTHAEALRSAGRDRFAVALLTELAEDIVYLDGPELEQTLDLVQVPILTTLRELGALETVTRLEGQQRSAERRLAAWREVEGTLSLRAERGADRRVVRDQYGSGYLLVYSEIAPGVFGAVQLDQPVLVRELLSSSELDIVITDPSGERFGASGPGQEVAVSVSFPRMMSHLQLGYPQSYMNEVAQRYRAQFFSQLLPILVGGIIGVAALAARVTADRREIELLDRQREFATRVTHELKTPLAGIRVMAENLEMGAAGDAETIRAFSGRILAETDKLTTRIDEILNVARSRQPARPLPYDPKELVDGVLREWAPRFGDAGVVLVREVNSVGQATGDVPMLRDAVVCLLDNALKYRRPDRFDPRVVVRLNRDGPDAVLEIIDNGLGVPAGKRKVIFQAFARVEGPGRGKAGGHGLGLSFVADTASNHGGEVACTSGIEGGARFVLRLPLVT